MVKNENLIDKLRGLEGSEYLNNERLIIVLEDVKKKVKKTDDI